MTTREKIILFIIIIAMLIFAFAVSGCDSQGVKQLSEMLEEVKSGQKAQQKQVSENDQAIKGNKNKIKTVTKNVNTFKSEVKTDIKKTIDNKSKQLQDAMDAKIDKIEGNLEQNQDNDTINNSIWTYVVMGAIILGLVFLFLWFYKGFPYIGLNKK